MITEEMIQLKNVQATRFKMAVTIGVCFLIVDILWLGYIPRNYCNRIQTTVEYTDSRYSWSKTTQTLYIITPTYPRDTQIPELTRLSQTLMNVPNLVWLVIEDAKKKTKAVEKLLFRTKLNFIHLVAPMPRKYKVKTTIISKTPRGVSNRNRGLRWLRANATSGVFYFADDDNTYDIRLFEEIRDTKRVSMFPVGFLINGFTAPILKDGVVQGFCSAWSGNRTFQMDMAGFAVSIEFLLQRPRAIMPYTVGFEEDRFLKSFAPFEINEIECKASNCTEILVWHTQTKIPQRQRKLNMTRYKNTNIPKLYNSVMGYD